MTYPNKPLGEPVRPHESYVAGVVKAAFVPMLSDRLTTSRECDAEIMFDLYAVPVGVSTKDGGPVGYIWPEDNPSWNLGIRFPGRSRDWFKDTGEGEKIVIERGRALVLMNSLRIPKLTTSLDAAASLYLTLPDRIPSDPLECCREALKQRGL